MATFILGGFWHGAGWTFLFWGFLHGLALAIHRLWQTLGFKMWTWLAWLITFNFVNIAWVFFRAKEWDDAIKVLSGMVFGKAQFSIEFATAINYVNPIVEYFKIVGVQYNSFVGIYTFEFIILAFALVLLFKNIMEKFLDKNIFFNKKYIFKYTVICSILFLLAIFKSTIQTYSEFIYFNF